jgi:hypothetical protein
MNVTYKKQSASCPDESKERKKWVESDTVVHMWSPWLEDFQILCILKGKIHGRTHGCKWSLLKVREGKYKREQGGAQVESGGGESMLLFSRYF